MPTAEAVAGARRIVVFRALQLGDVLVATPALRALRAACPTAEILLVGLPWARDWAARSTAIDRFEPFPGHPALPEQPPGSAGELDRLVARLRDWRADLALQLHGDGRISNRIVAAFGARRTAGFHPAGFHPAGTDAPGDGFVPWPDHGTEAERLLRPLHALGIPATDLALSLPIQDADRRALDTLLPSADAVAPLALVHPGARLASRRWPAERFAAVADRLLAHGWRVAVTGTPGDRAATDAMRGAMRYQPLDLTGRTTLWTLGALVERADLVITNDTGVSHVAAATRTPSVVVCSGADPLRWRPTDLARHRVLAHPVGCRPCAHVHCPTRHECALGVTVDAVMQAIADLSDGPPDPRRAAPVATT